ncbi:hypothetical protein QQ008_15650 [Fulvivirgaceae bacterium BMA10]|uniref:DUF5655 domain-containing protein n=1 Tax=Splendidivirga corallicola TaxID=3051826 RepID=A0ABT8KQ09_9BACT|nr:hypothetical protein [Fulvivirgaceae bacterium BMA10]
MTDRTQEIITRFQNSWNETEEFYLDLFENYDGFEFIEKILEFIGRLKKEGKNKLFRLGTSMYSLIISRPVDFGLRTDQKYIRIEFIGKADFEVILRDGDKIYREYRINDLSNIKLKQLIKTLEDTLID